MVYEQMDKNATRSESNLLRSRGSQETPSRRTAVKELVAKGFDAEPEYVELINELNPGMSAEQRKKLIKQFRDAVYDQQPDLPGR